VIAETVVRFQVMSQGSLEVQSRHLALAALRPTRANIQITVAGATKSHAHREFEGFDSPRLQYSPSATLEDVCAVAPHPRERTDDGRETCGSD